ncbi:large conductance mechanosensitive channel protein MscL [Candidatus Avelusimicrobium caledoniensis]|uniref:large conductance mechanosensitive channel protein MscL n=1 Tax=Candidatus Avelusimicrobium caledoniensis TaxID=3416220 RepID=UPI003D0BE426
MMNEFKKFVMRGSVIDMAVGIIIGGAFTKIVNSMVADVMMPPLGLLIGKVDFSNWFVVIKQGTTAGPYATIAEAQSAGATTMNLGLFLNAIISFVIVAFCIFLLIKAINKLNSPKEQAPIPVSTKKCPYCCSEIALEATRCPHCTSEIK